MMVPPSNFECDPVSLFEKSGAVKPNYQEGQVIHRQGDVADSLFYIHYGSVKETLVSSHGKERVVAILKPADFFGVGCVVGRTKRLTTATALTACSLTRIEKSTMVRLLHEQPSLSELFILFLIDRNNQYQDDLVSHLFNSSEKRLARALLLLSDSSQSSAEEMVVPKISQEALAEIVGTTRSRINFFMNKFRQLGLVEYHDEIRVRRSLLDAIQYEKCDADVK